MDRMLVSINHTLHAITLRVKNVAVYSKTMLNFVAVRRDSRSEAKHRDLLVCVVVLQDVTDGSDSIQILIPVHVQVMK